jgi:hypothetical protein
MIDHDDDDRQKQPSRESVRCPFLVGDGGSRVEGRRRRGRGDRVPAPASTRTFFFARPSATSRLFHSPMRAWGGTERGRVRAARASLGTSAFGRGATRERATSISARPKRCRPRARAEKRRLSSRRIQFAPTPPVYPRHASPKWAAITGAANATDTGCVAHTTLGARPFATRRAASIARSRLVDFLRSIRATRKHVSSARSTPGRACHLLSAHSPTSPVFSHTLHASYTRRRMAVTTAAAAAAGSALPR